MELVTISNLNPLSKLRPTEPMSIDYAVTFTLKPNQYKNTYEKQLHDTAGGLCKIYHDCKFTLVAELTQTYNIHYHGIISIPLSHGRDPIKYFFDRLRPFSKIGKCECKQLMNYQLWVDYLNKDIIKHIELGLDPIIRDDYNVLKTEEENYN